MKIFNLCLAISCVAMLVACGGEQQQDTGPKYDFEKADSLPSGYLEELGFVRTNIEVTAKLFEQLQTTGAAFNEGIMLSAGKSFSGNKGQAMGLGAVGSDLVYATSFGQNQSAMNRMQSLVDLSNKMGISKAFDQELLEKLASEDTTINKSVILTKAYLNAKDQLFSDERAQLATFMVVGGWIEGLHLACQSAQGQIGNMDIKIGVWEICNMYENVTHMMTVFENNAEMKQLLEDVKALGPELNPVRNNAKKYSEEDLKKVAESVANLRNKVL